MKEYEIHTTATYTTDGGTTEGSYFVEYITAKNMAEAKQILRAELKAAGVQEHQDGRYRSIRKQHAAKKCCTLFLLLYVNVKHGKKAPECVLTVKTGINQIAFSDLPFGKPAVVKRLFSVFDDERRDAIV